MEEEKSHHDRRRAVGALSTHTGHPPLTSVDLCMISLAEGACVVHLRTSQKCQGFTSWEQPFTND